MAEQFLRGRVEGCNDLEAVAVLLDRYFKNQISTVNVCKKSFVIDFLFVFCFFYRSRDLLESAKKLMVTESCSSDDANTILQSWTDSILHGSEKTVETVQYNNRSEPENVSLPSSSVSRPLSRATLSNASGSSPTSSRHPSSDGLLHSGVFDPSPPCGSDFLESKKSKFYLTT